ncbi:hypothetical protein HDU67_005938 [Dinochytrium kinnereticum]|nr:hypothetical protein HDU67_005938 [Dinochytrium kinnereticum]
MAAAEAVDGFNGGHQRVTLDGTLDDSIFQDQLGFDDSHSFQHFSDWPRDGNSTDSQRDSSMRFEGQDMGQTSNDYGVMGMMDQQHVTSLPDPKISPQATSHFSHQSLHHNAFSQNDRPSNQASVFMPSQDSFNAGSSEPSTNSSLRNQVFNSSQPSRATSVSIMGGGTYLSTAGGGKSNYSRATSMPDVFNGFLPPVNEVSLPLDADSQTLDAIAAVSLRQNKPPLNQDTARSIQSTFAVPGTSKNNAKEGIAIDLETALAGLSLDLSLDDIELSNISPAPLTSLSPSPVVSSVPAGPQLRYSVTNGSLPNIDFRDTSEDSAFFQRQAPKQTPRPVTRINHAESPTQYRRHSQTAASATPEVHTDSPNHSRQSSSQSAKGTRIPVMNRRASDSSMRLRAGDVSASPRQWGQGITPKAASDRSSTSVYMGQNAVSHNNASSGAGYSSERKPEARSGSHDPPSSLQDVLSDRFDALISEQIENANKALVGSST